MSVYMRLKYKTKFTDKEILKRAIEQAKYTCIDNENELICNITFYELHLRKNKNKEYEIIAQGYNDYKGKIQEFKNKITPLYNQLAQEQLQKQICDEIKKKVAKSKAMKLIQEETCEDNSIILTISV